MNKSFFIKCSLVVHNDIKLFQQINTCLTNDRIHCDHASNAEQAISLINNHSYDLIIAGIRLPDMDGICFMQQVIKDYPHGIIIIIDSDTPLGHIEILEKGAMDVLSSPLHSDCLRAAIYKANKNIHLFKTLANSIPQETLQQIEHLDIKHDDLLPDDSIITADSLNMEQEKKVSDTSSQLTKTYQHQIKKLQFENHKLKVSLLSMKISRDRLNTHLEQTPLAYMEWTLDFQLENMNPVAEQLFGYSLCDVKGTYFLDTIRVQDGEKIKYNVMDQFIMKNVTKDGAFVYCRWFNTFISGANNQIIGISSIVEDTTELHNANKAVVKALAAKEEYLGQLKHEYNMASSILTKLLKKTKQDFPHVNFLRRSMEIACGDIALAFDKPSGGLYIFLGDFTGHGLAAAIGAIPVVDMLIEMTSQNSSIHEILYTMNQKINDTMPTGKFLAAIMMEYSYTTNMLKVWNGGNPDIIVVDSKGIKKKFPSGHLPLGVLEFGPEEFIPEEFQTAPNDRVYALSDGIIETFNAQQEIFGIERFEKILKSAAGKENAIEQITQAIDSFRGDIEQQDDVTLVELICVSGMDIVFVPVKDNYRNYQGWKIAIKLDSSVLRQRSGVPEILIQTIEQDLRLSDHKESLVIILQELMANAFDYGLLKLDGSLKKTLDGYDAFFINRLQAIEKLNAGWIDIDVELMSKPHYSDVIIQIKDSGAGFNYPKMLTSLKTNLSFSGRGLSLIKSISHEMHFLNNGSCIRAIYRIKDNEQLTAKG